MRILNPRLVLQVHDELLIETCKEEIPQVSAILEEEMKGAAKLSVELEVDMHQGNNWYEAKMMMITIGITGGVGAGKKYSA
mgnify:CR=1 FL=1